jgi:hypothetical protein
LQASGHQRVHTVKSKTAEIKLVNKDINHTNRIVFTNSILKCIWKKIALQAINALNKTLHQILPQETEES